MLCVSRQMWFLVNKEMSVDWKTIIDSLFCNMSYTDLCNLCTMPLLIKNSTNTTHQILKIKNVIAL